VRLVVDTNILVRISRGRAMHRAAELRRAGATLIATENHANECVQVLIDKFGMADRDALHETARVLTVFEVIGIAEYGARREDADRRLPANAKSDWPGLAAALALGAGMWSDDRDYFGVGVPVWSTPNVRLAFA